MKKMYQVFISSTFEDLKEERFKVLNALLSFSCIPAGMEIFSAGSDEQFNYIKRVLDTVDYYVLIVGGRYGSIAKDGKSYTEKEFDYAISKDIPVIAFLHKHPEDLPSKYVEQTDAGKKKLEDFKARVITDRMVDWWENGDELATKVISGLRNEFNLHPRQGWIRGEEEGLPYGTEITAVKNELIKFQDSLSKQISLKQPVRHKVMMGYYKKRYLDLVKQVESRQNPKEKNEVIINLTERSIEAIVQACYYYFANSRIGSLICIEKTVPLDMFMQTGVMVDAVISTPLLQTIFDDRMPLHDGAVIIRDNRLTTASTCLPLSTDEKGEIPIDLGMRHRAAVGITEISDCVAIVTSEETGNVSIAYEGKLHYGIGRETFQRMLKRFLSLPVGEKRKKMHE